MKTSVELDSEKVKLARELSHVSTLKEMLDQALDAFIESSRRRSMEGLLGTDFFDGDLTSMRERRGRSRR